MYSGFTREQHVVEHTDAVDRLEDADDSDRWRMYGYDAGWKDPRVVLEIGWTDYGQLVVLDEFHASGSHVEDAIRWFRNGSKPKGWVHAEHEPADIQKFREAGIPARKAEKSIDAGISEVRRRLETDDEDCVGLLVSKRCQHLIREFLGYKEDHVGTSQATDHALDALRYAVMGHSRHGGRRARSGGDDADEYLWSFEFGDMNDEEDDSSGSELVSGVSYL